MKPIKSFLPFVAWLFRISILLIAYVYFFELIKAFQFNNISYYVNFSFAIFAVLLFIGGFVKKATLTVFSGIILTLLSAYQLFLLFDVNPSIEFVAFAFTTAAAMFFVTLGNKT